MSINRIYPHQVITLDPTTELHMALADKIEECRRICRDAGLGSITKFTLVARDPHSPDMHIVVLDDESLENRQAAASLLLNDEWEEADGE